MLIQTKHLSQFLSGAGFFMRSAYGLEPQGPVNHLSARSLRLLVSEAGRLSLKQDPVVLLSRVALRPPCWPPPRCESNGAIVF